MMTTPRLRTVRSLQSLMVAGLAVIGAACGGDGDTPSDPGPSDPIPTTVELSVGDSRLLVGNSLSIDAIVRDETGTVISGFQVTWTSSEPSVVSVDGSGGVTAVSGGSATITASAQQATQSVIIDVPEPVGTVSAEGGTLEDEASGVQITVPAGAVSQDVAISIAPATTASLPASGTLIGGTAHEFGPAGLQFNEPVALTIPFDPATLPPGLREARLAIHKVVDGAWAVEGDSEVDESASTVTTEITGFSTLGVLPLPNSSPTVLIESPPDGSTVFEGASVEFRGSATDPEDGALVGDALEWVSDRDGSLGTGEAITRSDLSIGVHTISLTAVDQDQAASSASIQLTVEELPNQPPAVEISNPTSGQEFSVGTTVEFEGTAVDPEDGTLEGESLQWTSDLDGEFGTGNTVSTSNLRLGSHVITLTATDSDGVSASASIEIEIVANQPPTVTITSPTHGLTVFQGVLIAFSGSATDPEDGALTGAALVWRSSQSGPLGTGTAFSRSDLFVGVHTISLTATDSEGLSAATTTTITILGNRPPVPTILQPDAGTVLAFGFSVTFVGQGVDPEDGVLGDDALAWSSNLDGALGSGQELTVGSLSLGTHVITLTATDSKGQSASTTRSFPVVNPVIRVNVGEASQVSVLTQGSLEIPVIVDMSGAIVLDLASIDVELSWDPALLTYVSTTSGEFGSLTVNEDNAANGSIGAGLSNATGTTTTFTALVLNLTAGTQAGSATVGVTVNEAEDESGTSVLDETETRDLTVTIENQPPFDVTITSPNDEDSFTEGNAIQFAGSADDVEDGSLTGAALSWTSSLDGPVGIGVAFDNSGLSAGDHVITLTATDSNGASTATSISISVLVNQPPAVSITSPVDETTVSEGDQVDFAGSATDPEDGALTGESLSWTSSLDGQIGTGTAFSRTDLSIGAHTITLSGTDSQGLQGLAAVSLTIIARQAPVPTITSPADQGAFTQGDPVQFTGSASDFEDGDLSGGSLVWSSSIDEQIGTGTSFTRADLSLGQHTITLTATDSDGMSAPATVQITVSVNSIPQPSITEPTDGAALITGDAIAFSGSANDAEDGALTGESLVWRSSIDGVLGTGETFSRSDLSDGTHTITLTATDSRGASMQVSVEITIAPNQPPVPTITSPTDGSTVNEGTSVDFAGSAADPEDGALTGAALVWTSDLDGALGTGATFSRSDLSIGVHTVSLTATDSRGLSATTTITLTVQPPPPEIRVQLGSSESITVGVGSQVDLPVNVDMTNAGGLNIASIDVRVTWSTVYLTFADASPGNFGSAIINETDTSNGVVRAVVFAASGTTNSFVAFNLSLTGAAAIASTTVTVEVLTAGDELGQNIIGSVVAVDLTVTVQN